MEKNHIVHALSALLAVLMLVSCASQTADEPLPTITIKNTSNVTTNSTTSASVTTTGNTPVVTTESGDDVSTSSEIPTTISTPAESETQTPATSSDKDTPSGATPETNASDPATDPPESNQTPTTSPVSSHTPTASKAPETSKAPTTTTRAETTTTTKKATSQTPATTVETPVPTPHTHSWGGWMVTKAATCTADGSRQRTCSGCGEVQRETIFSHGHSWSGWIVTKEPTTEEEGVETTTCIKCGAKETRSIAKLPEPTATPADCEWMVAYFLKLYNEERVKAGVQTLVTDANMHEMAQVRADELTVYFSHERPDGMPGSFVFRDFQYGNYYDMTQFGFPASYNYYSPSLCDEDIGMVFLSGSTKELLVTNMLEAFRRSTAHWNSMMNGEFGAVGIAVSTKESQDYPGEYEFYFEVLLSDKLY